MAIGMSDDDVAIHVIHHDHNAVVLLVQRGDLKLPNLVLQGDVELLMIECVGAAGCHTARGFETVVAEKLRGAFLLARGQCQEATDCQ